MGKKARIRRYPQKYGRKHASHPYAKAATKLREVIEEAEADGVITEEEAVQIKQAKETVVEAVVEAAVEEVVEVIEKIEEIIKPVVKKATKKKAIFKPRTTKRKKKTTKKGT
jgi:uncharacterized membrane protein YebE (DUF533 family)